MLYILVCLAVWEQDIILSDLHALTPNYSGSRPNPSHSRIKHGIFTLDFSPFVLSPSLIGRIQSPVNLSTDTTFRHLVLQTLLHHTTTNVFGETSRGTRHCYTTVKRMYMYKSEESRAFRGDG